MRENPTVAVLLRPSRIIMVADEVDRQTCAFVIRVWLEDGDSSTGDSQWRGHITHVLSSQRLYFEDLKEMTVFVEQYLEQMLVENGNHS